MTVDHNAIIAYLSFLFWAWLLIGRYALHEKGVVLLCNTSCGTFFNVMQKCAAFCTCTNICLCVTVHCQCCTFDAQQTVLMHFCALPGYVWILYGQCCWCTWLAIANHTQLNIFGGRNMFTARNIVMDRNTFGEFRYA